MEFRMTGPGRYLQRNGVIQTGVGHLGSERTFSWGTRDDDGNILHSWRDDGRWSYHNAPHPRDLVERLDMFTVNEPGDYLQRNDEVARGVDELARPVVHKGAEYRWTADGQTWTDKGEHVAGEVRDCDLVARVRVAADYERLLRRVPVAADYERLLRAESERRQAAEAEVAQLRQKLDEMAEAVAGLRRFTGIINAAFPPA